MLLCLVTIRIKEGIIPACKTMAWRTKNKTRYCLKLNSVSSPELRWKKLFWKKQKSKYMKNSSKLLKHKPAVK